MSIPPPLPLDDLRDRITRLEAQVKELRRQQPTEKGDRWRYSSLVIATLAGLLVAAPGAIETPWFSARKEKVDAVGIIGAAAAAYGVWRGRRVDQQDED